MMKDDDVRKKFAHAREEEKIDMSDIMAKIPKSAEAKDDGMRVEVRMENNQGSNVMKRVLAGIANVQNV